MQFKPEMVEAILAGRKTVTRRPADVYDRRFGPAGDYNLVERRGRVIYGKGRSYAVQPGRGKTGVARIQIDRLALGYLHEMKPSDAVAEGFADLNAFRKAWKAMYGVFDHDLLVYVIRFRLLGGKAT